MINSAVFWIYNNHFHIDVKKKYNIVSLNGGKAFVPYERYLSFLQQIASCIERGDNNMYFVECKKKEKFKMILDLDFEQPEAVSNEKILEYAQRVVRDIKIIYEDDHDFTIPSVIISSTPPGEKKVGIDKTVIKSAAHLVWMNLWLSAKQALAIRKYLINQMTAVYGYRDTEKNENSWEDVIDITVLDANGLRMLGCAKWDKCECMRRGWVKRTLDCQKCNDERGRNVGRVYTVQNVLTDNGDVDQTYTQKLHSDPLLTLIRSSIQVDCQNAKMLTSSGEVLPDHIIHPADIAYTKLQTKVLESFAKITLNRKRKKTMPGMSDVKSKHMALNKNAIAVHSDNSSSMAEFDHISECLEKSEVNMSSPPYSDLCQYIYDKMPGNPVVRKIVKNVFMPTGVKFPYEEIRYFCASNSHFCANINRNHNSNTTYFIVSDKGITQRCHCKCSLEKLRDSHEKALKVPCAQFRSEYVPLTATLHKKLFKNADQSTHLSQAKQGKKHGDKFEKMRAMIKDSERYFRGIGAYAEGDEKRTVFDM